MIHGIPSVSDCCLCLYMYAAVLPGKPCPTVPCVPQLSQVRQAAASLERVAGAMARQAAGEHHGRDSRAAFTVGPVENRDQHRDQRRSSASISF